MNKKLATILIILSIVLTGCDQIFNIVETEDPTTSGEGVAPFRVAAIFPSSIKDLAYSQSMYESLLNLQAEMGEDALEVAFVEGVIVVTDAEDLMEQYAQEGYDLVISHSELYGVSVQQIAGDYPGTSFAWGTSTNIFPDLALDNVYAYEARAEEGGYVLGVMAANLTQNSHIGFIGPSNSSDAVLFEKGFGAGIHREDPEATFEAVYLEGYSNISLAAEAAKELTTSGADVLSGSAQMFVGAIKVAQEDNALWFGNQYPSTAMAPDVVVASQVYHWEVVLEEMIALVQSGVMGGKVFSLTMANQGLTIDYNPGYSLPAEVQDKADAATRGVLNGSITVEVGE